MKRHLLISLVTAICFGLSSKSMANLTLSQSGSNQPGAVRVKDDSKDPDFFLIEWLYKLFGWDSDDYIWIHNPTSGSGGSGDGGWGDGSGDGSWGDGSGDGGWGDGSGDGSWGDGSGDGGWGGGSDDGGWGDGSGSGDGGSGWSNPVDCPVNPIPAPGALLLGSIGSGLVTWLRRRRTI